MKKIQKSAINRELMQSIVDYLLSRPCCETMNMVLGIKASHELVEVKIKEETNDSVS